MKWREQTNNRQNTVHMCCLSYHTIMNISSSRIRTSINKMMNMTFPLSYRFFFYFCHGEGRNFVSFVFHKVANVLTHLKVSMCVCVCTVYSSTSRQNQGDRRIQKVRHEGSPGGAWRHENRQEPDWVSGTTWVLMLFFKNEVSASSHRSVARHDDSTQTQFEIKSGQ